MPMFVYEPQVPQANQQKNVSQPIMESNFQAIEELVTVNHVDFNTADFGKHAVVQMPVQAGTPAGLLPGETAMYNKNNTNSTKNETYLSVNSVGGPFQVPITASVFGTTATPAPVSTIGSGWCYLPCGLIMKWGTFNAAAAQPYVFPTSANIPVFTTAVLSFQATIVNTGIPYGGIINCLNITKTNFNWVITNPPPSVAVSYLAIGY